MTHPIRSIFAVTILTIVLVACGTTVGAPSSETPAPSEPPAPSVQPSVQPSVAPSEVPVEPSQEPADEEPAAEEREVHGTITMAEMAYSGPGGSIQDALDNGPDGDLPSLVNGVLFQDPDGSIYLADSLSDASAPTFEGPMLKVLNMPNDGHIWDLANAADTNLQEANGIRFFEQSQVLGFIELP